MCFGRPASHIQAEAQREADRQSAEMEQQMRAAEERNRATLEAMKPKYTPPPTPSGATMSDMGVQRKKARKSSVINASQGVSSLRIPLNTGGSNGGNGPNMG